MDWVSTLLTGGALVRDLSWTFACPSHCGSSFLVPLISGFALGCFFGLILGLWICFQFSRWLFHSPLSEPTRVVPEPRAPVPPRPRHRLSGYLLHE